MKINENDARAIVVDLLKKDQQRMKIIETANLMKLNSWCIAAGFIRNMVWDFIFKSEPKCELNDIDLIYYDKTNIESKQDLIYEQNLKNMMNINWEVKNQARMHLYSGSAQFESISESMSYWPEYETCVGVYLDDTAEIKIIAPFGVACLFENTITKNPKTKDQTAFDRRVINKNWLENWKGLKIKAGC